MIQLTRKSLFALVILSTCLVLLPTPMLASPLATLVETVVNTNDVGPGSLRQAILDVDPGGTVKFNPTLLGSTIYLTSTISITKNLTIDGETYNITLSGDTDKNGFGNVTIFDIDSTAAVTLSHLTITRGKSTPTSLGGGIYNRGSLIVNNCTFAKNETTNGGGGISNFRGFLTVNNSTFSENTARDGGGINNYDGKLIVYNSIFSGNKGTSSVGGTGGGIDSFSTNYPTIIFNSTFVNNSSSRGGGIQNNYSSLWVSNSTFAGNIATTGGGISHAGSDMHIYNSTFSGNSAYVYGGAFQIEKATGTIYNSTLVLYFPQRQNSQ